MAKNNRPKRICYKQTLKAQKKSRSMRAKDPKGNLKAESEYEVWVQTWRPAPDLTTEYARALRDDLAKNGQQVPILVTQSRQIIDGRLRYGLLCELGITPSYKVVESIEQAVFADLLKKTLTVVDQARIVRAVFEGEFGSLPQAAEGERQNERTAKFIAEKLSWLSWSPRKVNQAVQLAKLDRAMLDIPEVRKAKSVFGALVAAGVVKRPGKKEIGSDEVPAADESDDGMADQSPAEQGVDQPASDEEVARARRAALEEVAETSHSVAMGDEELVVIEDDAVDGPSRSIAEVARELQRLIETVPVITAEDHMTFPSLIMAWHHRTAPASVA